MTTPTLRANTELVAIAWIASIPGFLAGVAAQVPQDSGSWAEHGFATVMAVGGVPHAYMPLRRPVVQIDCFATQSTSTLTSNKPPWYKANLIAEQIVAATHTDSTVSRLLTLKPGYPQARVLIASAITEPMRIPNEQVGAARFSFDIRFHWAELPP